MKKLERMLLINWHYISKEMIEFSNINFLTGKNGSGKSTIIDALQLLLLGDTRGNFFNKAANDRTERTLEGYLRGEIGDDGDTGYKYLRSGKFSSYIVCEFYDTVTRKNFCIGVVFDVYNESGFEHKFFMFNGSIPENEFIGENNIPFSFAELKSFLTRKYGNKNLEICTSNTQYQVAVRGKLGGLNQKFFNLFKKAVTFTPINDIEKFIVEYVCDVKNQIDITSMQENIRQYNSLLKQVDVMNTQKNQLQEIENTYNGYLDECMKQREAQYLIWRAEKQQLIDEYENLQKQVQDDKDGKVSLEETTTQLEKTKGEIEKEISDLTVTRANSDIKIKSDKITAKIQEIDSKLNNISEKASKNIATLRNYTLRWNASISKLESAKDKVNYQNINNTRDLIKYIDSINENIFNELDINAITETRNNISDLINWGTSTYFDKKYEIDNKKQTREVLIQDIEKLKNGINPYDSQFINFKAMLEARLKEKFCKDIEVSILADLLEIKDARWQNAIEGYLNTQKKYLIIDPQYFEEASKIYRELARENEKIHSFGIVDIEKIRKDNASNALENSLATEVITENELARTYVDYLLGRVIKCETIEELRSHKQAITSDCMLYQGYVLRKIDPKFYKYPVIGKKALEQQKQIKENGYPPSVREIGKSVGLSSTATVHGYLTKLEQKGYIKKENQKGRTLRLLKGTKNSNENKPEVKEESKNLYTAKEMVEVPIVGKITAGAPILAVENISDTFPIPIDFVGNSECFMLTVSGESMIEAGILDGDYILVKKQNVARNGEIVVALIGDEATVKTFYKESDHIRLQPENSTMDPIIVSNCEILGKVAGVFRKL